MKWILFSALAVASFFPRLAQAQDGQPSPYCPDGYVIVHDEQDESEISDRNGKICVPADRASDWDYWVAERTRDFWATIAYSSVGSELFASWDQYSEDQARKVALETCKKGLKEKKIKAKCLILGSWANGDGVVSQGDSGKYFLGESEESALAICRGATSNCTIVWGVKSYGTGNG